MLAKKCLLVGIVTLLSVSLAIADPPAVHPTTGEPLVIDCLRGTPEAIDGDLSDWNLEAMTPAVLDAVEQLSSGQDIWENVGDCGGEFYMLWDDENIYIAVVVTDDKLSMNKTDGDIWNSDCIEVLFSTTDARADHSWSNPTIHYQYGFNANNQIWNWCNMAGPGQSVPDYLQAASSITADGYICEVSIRHSEITPLDWSVGSIIGFHPCIDDTDIDNGDTEYQMSWTGLPAHDQSLGFGHMVLSADTAAETEPPAALPEGWQSQDIGTTGGSAAESDGTWAISADGADIWGSTDEFHYAYMPLSGGGTIIARVVSNGEGSNGWAKGGVMIRETLDADSKHAIMALTGGEGGGMAFQNRQETAGSSFSSHGDPAAAPPYWVKLTRVGNTITGYSSADGVDWVQQPDGTGGDMTTNPVDIEMAADVYIGLFVTSHASGEVRTYTFDNVSIEPPKVIPEGWQSQDIGTTGGSAAESDGTWAISADGTDIWGNSDEFHYAYVPLSGDAKIEARVVDNGAGSNTWAKGGVMIRQSLDGDSINVFGAITGGDGDGGTFQWRSVQGESSSSNRTLTGIAPPYYVRLVREGNTFTVYMSADGVEWAQEGENPVTIEMTDPVLIGLAVTSHAAGEVRTFMFDNVSIELLNTDVTAPGDTVQGVPNDGDWPGAETPDLAIDDNVETKYLHFKGDFDPDPGTGGAGFQVTPAAGPSIVTGLTLTTANDVPGRDPIAFELSGSNEGIDGPYELIASGEVVDFAQEAEWPRFTMNATPISFKNDTAYAHYQLIFTAIRGPVGGSVNSMQIAEVELLGQLYVDPDIAAIKELYNQAALACSTGDAELYLSIFTEDAVVMAPGSTAFIGKKVLRAATEGLFGLFDLELPYTVDEVGIPGDWAFARSSFQYSMTPKEGGETTTRDGKELDILKRQADGSWKIYIQCYNYDAPLPAPSVAATSPGLGLVKLAQVDDADAMYRGMCDLYTLAVETGDTDLYVANYTDDGVQMPPETPTRIGSEQIRAAIEPALALFDAECPIYPREAVITGDWAFGYCDWSLSLTPKEGGPTTTFNGKGLDVIKRQADGSWKYYIECWNYNGPPIVEE